MASTYTDNLRLTKQGTGDNPNTWGVVVNQQVIDLIDESIAGVAEINCTGSGAITLTSNNGSTDEARQKTLKLTGTPTANRTITAPAVEKVYIVDATALTTGETYTITIEPSGGGNGVAVTASKRVVIYCDGTDMFLVASNVPFDDSIDADMLQDDSVRTSAIQDNAVTEAKLATGIQIPAGSITAFAGSSTPTGWLLCFGQAVSRTTYADLFTALGTTYGSGDGSTTFNLPDLRGRFVAGKDDMGGSSASRLTGAVSGGIDGSSLGNSGGEESFAQTSAQLPSHNHTNPGNTANVVGGGGIPVFRADFPNSGTTGSTGSGDPMNNVPPGIVLNYIIKT